MTDELKPCPFCGGKAEFEIDEGWFVFCEKCGSMTVLFDTKPEAKETWNARPIEDKQASENKRLYDALDEIVNRNDFSRYCDISQLDEAIEDYNIQIDAIPLIRIAQRALKEAVNSKEFKR